MRKKYLISGLGVSEGGVGRLMRNLVQQAETDGFTSVVRRTSQPIGRMLKQKQYSSAVLEVFLRLLDPVRFFLRVQFIRDSTVVFVHPQTAGFSRFLKVVDKNNVYLYVMDNSFFCIRSYNLHPELEIECFRCLSGPQQVLPACQPFPIAIKKQDNLEYLNRFAEASSKITFLAQNVGQAELIKSRFGEQTRVRVVGLDTGELEDITLDKQSSQIDLTCSYDLVFHGAPQLAKGVRYFVELAEMLDEFTAFIPSSKTQCEQVLQRPITADNITFKECSWETGLKDAVLTCGLVVNPSLWSAPIEGALQKSIYYAGCVATVESLYGYEREYINSQSVIRLPRDVRAASDVIRKKFPGAIFPSVKHKLPKQITVEEKINIFKLVINSEN
ncbi:hypothetical protein ACEK06_09980 [Pseudomonas brenneri]|uniref:hypothetical protein n=1 Tax=Pseudomonas brenneri TaxID=129817 RepID=UPI003570F83C